MSVRPASSPSTNEPAAFEEAHRALLEDGSIQFELPAYEAPVPNAPPSWLRWLADFLSADHTGLRWILYAMLGAAALILAWLLLRWVLRSAWWRKQGGSGAGPSEALRPQEAPARALLAEADRLAAEGRYGQAAHLILFRSIEEIDRKRPHLVAPSFTSRDIAALHAIPEGPRGAFARIALMVEQSLFARAELGRSDWEHCRSAYEEFAFAEGWSR